MSSTWSKRAEALGAAAPASRGGRWIARQDGRSLAGVDGLASVPRWIGWPAPQRHRMAMTVALLHYRPRLDAELRSDVLAPLAALVGEALFDAVCRVECRGTGSEEPIPGAIQLGRIGNEMLANAWAPPECGESPDPYAAALAHEATELIMQQDAQ